MHNDVEAHDPPIAIAYCTLMAYDALERRGTLRMSQMVCDTVDCINCGFFKRFLAEHGSRGYGWACSECISDWSRVLNVPTVRVGFWTDGYCDFCGGSSKGGGPPEPNIVLTLVEPEPALLVELQRQQAAVEDNYEESP